MHNAEKSWIIYLYLDLDKNGYWPILGRLIVCCTWSNIGVETSKYVKMVFPQFSHPEILKALLK